MTGDRMTLVELILQRADSNQARETPTFAAEPLIDPEIEARP